MKNTAFITGAASVPSSNTPLVALQRPEREKLTSASKLLPTSAAVAIIGYPCRHVSQVSLPDAALPPRDTHPPPLTARATTRRRSSPCRFVAVPNPNRTAKF